MAYILAIPIDASKLEEIEVGTEIKIAAETKDGVIISQTVKLPDSGKASAKLEFKEQPGTLRVAVGPADASDNELMGLQTINFTVTARQWNDESTIRTDAVRITPHYWSLWRRWCRTFTVRGRIVCPDGSPVPGAQVCAYDVDWWWWWCSQQQLGCDTTDENGVFEMRFRHCCGWWPWWWWRQRHWHLEPSLSRQILPMLQDELKLKRLPRPSPRPDLKIFEELLAEDFGSGEIGGEIDIGGAGGGGLEGRLRELRRGLDVDSAQLGDLPQSLRTVRRDAGFDLKQLEDTRLKLIQRIPVVPKLERIRLWPWWPWTPWDDCSPDLIFRATQNCEGQNRLIVDETCWDTRWNVGQETTVTLVAKDACCIDDCDSQQECPDGDCVILSKACNILVDRIGGNPGAVAAPAGYVDPGVRDRPFAGMVPLRGLFGTGALVDFYEFEMSTDGGATFAPIPPATAGDISRAYWGPKLGDPTDIDVHHVPFSFSNIDGRRVIESREHFENNNEPGTWGAGNPRRWINNFDLLMNLKTENLLADDLYHFRLKSWQFQAATGQLINPRILPLCETEEDNNLVLRLDNRLVGPGSGHPLSTPAHPVTGVHLNTLEPDTDFDSIMIDGGVVDPCDIVDAANSKKLQIRFKAHDPDGHLYNYEILASYGENQLVNLLNRPSSVLVNSSAVQVGPSYSNALSQGATSPVWAGGIYNLSVDVAEAFPESCAYTLVLRARKRPILNCSGHYLMENRSSFSFTVMI